MPLLYENVGHESILQEIGVNISPRGKSKRSGARGSSHHARSGTLGRYTSGGRNPQKIYTRRSGTPRRYTPGGRGTLEDITREVGIPWKIYPGRLGAPRKYIPGGRDPQKIYSGRSGTPRRYIPGDRKPLEDIGRLRAPRKYIPRTSLNIRRYISKNINPRSINN